MEQFEKLKQLYELTKNDTVKPSDIERFLKVILQFITNSKSSFEEISKTNLNKIQNSLEYITREHLKIITDVSEKNSASKIAVKKELEKAISQMQTMCEKLMLEKPKDGEPGENAEFTEEVKYEIVSKTLVELKSKGIIISKKEVEKIIEEAIKKIPKGQTTIIESGGIGAPFEIPIKAGTNVTVRKDASGAYVISATAGSGSTITKETPTGDIDDSNLTFTVVHEPLFINVNGAIYSVGDGAYASYLAGTITLAYPVGTGGFISSFYNS